MPTLQLSPFTRRFLIGFAATLLQFALLAQTEVVQPSASGVIELATAAGLGSNLISGDLGLRFNPHANVSIEAGLGGGGWSRDLRGAAGASLPAGITEGTLQGKAMLGLRLKIYSGPEHTGFYGGIGVVQQGYKVEADSKFARPTEPRTGGGATSGLGLLLNILFSSSGPRYDRYTTQAEGTVRGLDLASGYAFGLSGGQRFEVGVNYTTRTFGGGTFEYRTPQGLRELKLKDHFGSNSFRVEVKYVVPLWR